MVRHLITISFLFLAGCADNDIDVVQPPAKKLTEVLIESENRVKKLTYQYDNEGYVTHTYLDDTLFIELINRESNLLTYRYPVPEPTDTGSSIPDEVSVQLDEANRIVSFEATVPSVSYTGNLPDEIILQHAMFFGLVGTSYSFDNTVSEIYITNDSILFDFLFYETIIVPIYMETERFTSAIWRMIDDSSPVPLPLQDLSVLGLWLYADGTFVPNGAMVPQVLMHVLNLSGFGTYIPQKLVGSKSYPEIPINWEFQYEFDEDGYVKKMTVSRQGNSFVGSFQFIYSD